jgi:hypothetical protein
VILLGFLLGAAAILVSGFRAPGPARDLWGSEKRRNQWLLAAAGVLALASLICLWVAAP